MAHTPATPGMDSLPTELVAQTLKHLNRADLCSVAEASRAFHALAWRAGLYIRRAIHLYDDLALLEEVFDHVVKKDLRLSLSVSLRPLGDSPVPQSLLQPGNDIIALISSVMPVLVNLSITADHAFVPALMEALRHPAPHISAFDLAIIRHGHPVQNVPADLFARYAPKLRRLQLSDASLGPLVPAFSAVDSVHLSYRGQFVDINYGLHFPHIRRLHLSSWPDLRATAPRSLKFDGLRLRALTVRDDANCPLMPAIRASLNLTIPHVEHITLAPLEWADPLWTRTDDGPVSMRVTAQRVGFGLEVLIVPAHRRWRRLFTIQRELGQAEPLPGLDMPRHGDRIAYLRLDTAQIHNLLMCRGVALRALRRLQVDITSTAAVWPPTLARPAAGDCLSTGIAPAGRTWHYVDCSALKALRLSGIERGVTVVDSDDVLCLSRALSQCPRHEIDRAALELVGIRLTAVAPVEQEFYSVRKYAFVHPDSPTNQDEGVWEDDD